MTKDTRWVEVITEMIVGIAGILIIGIKFSWWAALAVFLLMFSNNLRPR